MPLQINGATSGSTTINATDAVTVTLTLPSTTGTLAVNGPAFGAYQNSAQSITLNTWTKITLDVEEFDTNNNFTSSRFTPTVAGYYQINGSVYVAGGNTTLLPGIYKNGSMFKQGTYLTVVASVDVTVSSLIYMNGTTDYLELYAYSNATVNTGAYPSTTYLNGFLARSA